MLASRGEVRASRAGSERVPPHSGHWVPLGISVMEVVFVNWGSSCRVLIGGILLFWVHVRWP